MATSVSAGNRHPPVDYAIAVWLGTPKAELAQGLREGWIRAPAGVDVQSWAEQRGLPMANEHDGAGSAAPLVLPAPEESSPAAVEENPTLELRRRIQALLHRFDPAMDANTFDSAWQEAGIDDAARVARFASFVARAMDVAIDPAADFAAQLAEVEDRASGHEGGARFLRIAASTSRELDTLAASEGSVRRALAEHSPWALTGVVSLANAGDGNGRFDRFDRDTGEQLLSDAWIADRAKHAAWRNAQAAGRVADIQSDGWRLIDRAAGEEATVEIGGTGGEPLHQVIFATDEGDRITGGAGTDRVHGGRGDDVVRGRAGNDLLEGGAGNDVLQGGTGRDVLAGQQGSDEIDGGTGDDDLSGGSGDDELIGGRGNDLLRGGAGADTYRFDDGDGNDTIEDVSGALVIDDVAVSGTMHRSGDGWTSTDGHLLFTLEGEGSGRSLVVRTSVEGNATAGGAIRIASWSDGAFGISLEAEDADDELAPGNGWRVPSDQIYAGNEAPLGANDALETPWPSERAEENGTTHVHEVSLAEGASSDGLLSLQHDASALVDVPDFASALDAWTMSAPPYTESATGASVGVTSFDIGDALASAEFESDDGEGSGSVSLDATMISLPLRNDGLRALPELSLRPSP